MPEVKLVNVTKRYGKILANDNINFTIKNGEYVSVIGPSGCGKTTLIKSIAGIIRPDEGAIYIDGKPVNELPIEDRAVGYVFQNIALFPHLTVWDNVTYGPKVRGWSLEETRPLVIEMLEMIKITTRTDAYPSELSGGMQQKTAVARALTSKAELLLLDEPLGALDVKVRAELRHELRKLVKDLQLTALHVTHDQEEAMSISDRVIVMKKGRIVESGDPFTLYTRPKHLFTANFVGEANFLTGRIVQTSSEASLVEIGDGLQLMANIGNQKMGARIVMVFRPEFVSIDNDKTVNRFSGTVADVIFSGNIFRVKVKLENGDFVVAKTAGLKPAIHVGNRVALTILPNHVCTYPYPDDGLHHALALE